MKKLVICLLCIISISSCSTPSFMCVPSARKVEVEDVFLEKYYIPSHKINTNDRYCLMYEPWNYKSNLKNFDINVINRQLIKSLKEHKIKIQEEELNSDINEQESKKNINKIIEREKRNNYNSCDYLITYYVVTSTEEKDTCSSTLSIVIQIIDIKNNNYIARYGLNKGIYKKQNQVLWTKELIDGLFKYQKTPNTKKQTTIECSSNGCRTIKCIGDECKIKNN